MQTSSGRRALRRRLAQSRGAQLSLGVVLLAILVAFWFAGDGRREQIGDQLGWPGAAALVVAQALMAVSPLPSQIVAVPIAVAYGFWLGVLLNWTGWMLAAVLQYWLSRRTADDIELQLLVDRTPQWLRRFPADHPVFLILARQLPIGPHIVNITAGVLHIPLWRHLWCAAIGVVPEAILVSGIAVGVFR